MVSPSDGSICINSSANDFRHIKYSEHAALCTSSHAEHAVESRAIFFYLCISFPRWMKLKWSRRWQKPSFKFLCNKKMRSFQRIWLCEIFMTLNECECTLYTRLWCGVMVKIDWIFIIAYKLHAMWKINEKTNSNRHNLIKSRHIRNVARLSKRFYCKNDTFPIEMTIFSGNYQLVVVRLISSFIWTYLQKWRMKWPFINCVWLENLRG